MISKKNLPKGKKVLTRKRLFLIEPVAARLSTAVTHSCADRWRNNQLSIGLVVIRASEVAAKEERAAFLRMGNVVSDVKTNLHIQTHTQIISKSTKTNKNEMKGMD